MQDWEPDDIVSAVLVATIGDFATGVADCTRTDHKMEGRA